MIDCRDCLHCKVNISKQTIRCDKAYWIRDNLKPKVFKINLRIEVSEANLNVKYRQQFGIAHKCPDFVNMNEKG